MPKKELPVRLVLNTYNRVSSYKRTSNSLKRILTSFPEKWKLCFQKMMKEILSRRFSLFQSVSMFSAMSFKGRFRVSLIAHGTRSLRNRNASPRWFCFRWNNKSFKPEDGDQNKAP